MSVDGYDVVFEGDNVIVEDTLTKGNDGRELQVNGSLTNNGTLTENNYGAFSINISGDLNNA